MGTFINGRRIAGGEILHDGDVIQLGPGGPNLRFRAPGNADSLRTANFGQAGHSPSGRLAQPRNQTIVAGTDSAQFQSTLRSSDVNPNEPRVFLQRALDQAQLTIGRGDECDIRLDGLLISNNHARISQSPTGLIIEDLNSTNGTYVNGERITSGRQLAPDDVVQIGPFLLRANPQRGITVFDTRAKTRLDVVKITKGNEPIRWRKNSLAG